MPIPEDKLQLIRNGVSLILEGLGEPLDGVHSKDTPRRVAEAYSKILDGNYDQLDKMTSFDGVSYNGMVMVRNVRFYSFCAHHMMLFTGKFALGYLPTNGKVLGLSKLVRIFRHGCKRLTTQEEVAHAAIVNMQKALPGVRGAMVHVAAEHTCMSCRGVQSHGAETVTIDQCGEFETDIQLRQTFLNEVARA